MGRMAFEPQRQLFRLNAPWYAQEVINLARTIAASPYCKDTNMIEPNILCLIAEFVVARHVRFSKEDKPTQIQLMDNGTMVRSGNVCCRLRIDGWVQEGENSTCRALIPYDSTRYKTTFMGVCSRACRCWHKAEYHRERLLPNPKFIWGYTSNGSLWRGDSETFQSCSSINAIWNNGKLIHDVKLTIKRDRTIVYEVDGHELDTFKVDSKHGDLGFALFMDTSVTRLS